MDHIFQGCGVGGKMSDSDS